MNEGTRCEGRGEERKIIFFDEQGDDGASCADK